MEGGNGLTTEEGLHILLREIEDLVEFYKLKLNKQKWRLFFSFMFGSGSCYTLLSFSCVFSMAFLLIFSSAMTDEIRFSSGSRGWIILEAIFLLISITVNLLLIWLKIKTFIAKTIGLKEKLLEEIYDCLRNNSWTSGIYPDLHIPSSPCISLQWCMRDGKPINLPTPLLVEKDVIIMRPGFPAPGLCQSMKDDTKLQGGEIYVKNLPSSKARGPQRRMPLSTEKFLLQETPILNNFRLMLKERVEKPQSFLENERNNVCNIWLERRLLLLFLVISLAVNLLRYIYVDVDGAHWSEVILILQIHTILPLTAVIFPILWIVVNTYGQAHIFAAFEVCRSLKENDNISESISSFSNISIEEARVSITYNHVFRGFWNMLIGRQQISCPNFEMLHTFGSVTAFCCLDKKGILSWPNPSVEKVFFFSSLGNKQAEAEENIPSQTQVKGKPQKKGHQSKKKMKSHNDADACNIEVLDLTNEPGKNGFGIAFDDPRWKDHQNALKPMGLSILLNTCNHETSAWYSQFTDHVSCAAKNNKDTVAVVNRRCMCHLSQEIGFTKDAANVFNYESIFGLYRQVPVEDSEKEKVHRARSAQHSQHKIPMPNQVSVLVRDKLSGMCQLLSQGTGDLILDCCSDVWTGTDLQVLSEIDRKRILDFYHRTSLIAYCTAFSYKPVPKAMEDWSNEDYTELVETPNTTKQAHGEDLGVFFDGDEAEPSGRLRSYSMDSLLDFSPNSSVEDVGVGQMLQSHQTFIGMVSLQYQARQDFVQLIDQLESACIRFVHFSQENEVRSRVFSEKLGLEAGWNCHVSLMCRESIASASSSCKNLSSMININAGGANNVEADQNLPSPPPVSRTHSAPSFVNTEEVQVKFAKEPLPIVIDEGQDVSTIPTVICTTSSMAFSETECGNVETVGILNRNSVCKYSEHSSVSDYEEKPDDKSSNNPKELEVPLLSSDREKCEWDEEDSDEDDEEEDYDCQSDSRYTSSYITENTEDSLTGGLDNRAHLPQGIENIRPHLKNVDNVPLLVNLFTDCTPEATCEMVKIMQENGEVVLVLGSSLNVENTSIFLQADCSIAVEPLFPQLCGMRPSVSYSWTDETPSPTQLASKIISLPCPLYFQREDNIKLIQLIMEARHFIFAMRNCFFLMLCCLLAVVLAQVMCTLLLLPPLMPVQHLLWLLFIIIPALGLSLMGNPNEARTMSMATHKNTMHVNQQMVIEFLVQFSTRFVPSIFMTILYFGLILYSFCENVATTHCSIYSLRLDLNNTNSTGSTRWTEKFQGGLVLAQNIFHLFFVFYLVVISMSLVHWQDHLWQRLPFKNVVWSITACILLAVQVVFSVADVYVRHTWFGKPLPLSQVHPAVWVLGCAWPFVIVALNEFAKRRDIRLAVRRQRRARLDFDTKLGMNSPF